MKIELWTVQMKNSVLFWYVGTVLLFMQAGIAHFINFHSSKIEPGIC